MRPTILPFVALLPVVGCATTEPAPTVTWAADIAPIVTARCGGCHTSGGIGPFPLDTYESASSMASSMAAAVKAGTMPPWGAQDTTDCTPPVPWKDDERLTDEEKQQLQDWADAGAPVGDTANAAALPEAPSLDLDAPTLELHPTEGFLPEAGADVFMCYSFDPGFTTTQWLTGMQILPEEEAVVHHVLVGVDSTGATAAEDGWYACSGGGLGGADQLIGAWAPGGGPFTPPAGTATRLEAGVRLVMQVHYHPAGAAAFDDDTTGFALRLTEDAPSREAIISLIGNADSEGSGLLPGENDPENRAVFKIPKDTSGHVETMEFTIPEGGPYAVFQAATHMHYVGVDERVEVIHAEPAEGEEETECLLETPKWDFNWQRSYVYDASIDELPELRTGDVIRITCTYDNVLSNPGVQQALSDAGETETRVVRLGETTLDEMCLVAVGLVLPG